MAGYDFRIRFNLPDGIRLDLDAPEWQLPRGGVQLSSVEKDTNIKGSGQLVLRGSGYTTEDEAFADGERWQSATYMALARIGVGVDFLERGARSLMTTAGLEHLRQQFGVGRLLNDEPGVMTFESDPPPTFASGSAKAVKIPSADKMQRSLAAAYDLDPRLTPQQYIAFELYGAAFFQTSAEARLLSLMMAIESLLIPAQRGPAERNHVQGLISATQAADLPPSEIASIVGSLRWLEQESIGQAGRRLAATLAPRTYMDLPPRRFFTACYALRSALVHGNESRPTWGRVNQTNGALELFVGDLLSEALLQTIPD